MDTRWRGVLTLAEEQYGLVTRRQMLGLQVTRRMVVRALEDGRLQRVAPEVFRVSGAPQTERMATAAAVLAADGATSFGASAALLKLDAPTSVVPIDVTVDAADRHPRIRRVDVETAAHSFHEVRMHRHRCHREPMLTVDGIRCTDGARTLIDLAGRLGQDQLEDAFERARRLGLVSAPSLARRFELVGGQGRKGAAKVRAVLEHARPGPLDSKLEGRVWRMIRCSSLVEPVRQFRVDIAPQNAATASISHGPSCSSPWRRKASSGTGVEHDGRPTRSVSRPWSEADGACSS